MSLLNSQSKFLNRMFRKIDGVVWDLSTNSIGLANKDGIYTLVTTPPEAPQESIGGRARVRDEAAEDATYSISVNPFDTFGFPIPAFAQLTKLSDVSIGDIVVGEKTALGWVTKVNERSLQLMDQSGMTKNYTPPKIAVLNQDGALVVKPLTGLFGEQGATGFSNALLPLLLAGEGAGQLDEILPLLLLTQQQAGGNGNAVASALPTILMMKAMSGGRGGKLDGLLLPMIMSGAFGGSGSGINPMMLMALSGEGFGGAGQFIAGDAPALQERQVTPPPLTIKHRY